MNGIYMLHCRRTHPEARPHQDLPTGPVRLVGEPRIGQRLIIVAEQGGVVQTSTVRRVLTLPTRLVVQTANSYYTLAAANGLADEAA